MSYYFSARPLFIALPGSTCALKISHSNLRANSISRFNFRFGSRAALIGPHAPTSRNAFTGRPTVSRPPIVSPAEGVLITPHNRAPIEFRPRNAGAVQSAGGISSSAWGSVKNVRLVLDARIHDWSLRRTVNVVGL